MRLSFLITATLFLGLTAHAQNKSDVVASIGTRNITLEEFNKKYNDVRAQSINPPTRAQFLEDLVRYEVGVQEAEKRKLDNDPIVKERMRQEMYKALLEKELGQPVQKIEVSEKEMKDFYSKNPEIRTSHILIEYKPGATAAQIAEARKRAEEIFAEVQKSKRPFEELVKLYSDDPLSKQAGGDTGWQTRVTLMPSYYETALTMKIGETRGLIETPFGFHIIKLTGKRSFENANKRQIRAAVFDEKRKIVFNKYFEKLKQGYSIKVNSNIIQ